MKRCSTCSSNSQSPSLLQSTGQALVRICGFFEVYKIFAQFCWSHLLRNIYMSGSDEHKNQGLVQQPQHCATLFLPLLAPLSSHLLPGANIILILIAPLWWFLKVVTKFTSSWSWSCYLFAYGSGEWKQMYQAWGWSWRGCLCQLWKVTNLLVHSCTILLCCSDGEIYDDPYRDPNTNDNDHRVE